MKFSMQVCFVSDDINDIKGKHTLNEKIVSIVPFTKTPVIFCLLILESIKDNILLEIRFYNDIIKYESLTTFRSSVVICLFVFSSIPCLVVYPYHSLNWKSIWINGNDTSILMKGVLHVASSFMNMIKKRGLQIEIKSNLQTDGNLLARDSNYLKQIANVKKINMW